MTDSWLRLDHAGMRWRVRPDAEARVREREWRRPASGGAGLRIVQSWGSRVSAVWEGAAADGGDLFVKWYGLRHFGEALRFVVTPSRPAAEWRMNRALAAAGIPVVECLALGERWAGGLWRGGVLILKAVTPPLTLSAFLRTAPEAEARRAVELAADLVVRFHAQGFCHHDLHGDNLLVQRRDGQLDRLLLTDLHEGTRHRSLSRGRWVGDLARLNAYTPAGGHLRLRFWRRYAAGRGWTRAQDHDWIRTIDRETRALWARHFKKRGTSIELY